MRIARAMNRIPHNAFRDSAAASITQQWRTGVRVNRIQPFLTRLFCNNSHEKRPSFNFDVHEPSFFSVHAKLLAR